MVDNVSLLTPELLSAVGRLVVESGHKVAKKKPGEPLRGRCDSFVVETDVHYPTDVNLLWDAVRCLLRETGRAAEKHAVGGWRQWRYLCREVKKFSTRRAQRHPEGVCGARRTLVERADKLRNQGVGCRSIQALSLMRGGRLTRWSGVFCVVRRFLTGVFRFPKARRTPVELGVPVALIVAPVWHLVLWEGWTGADGGNRYCILRACSSTGGPANRVGLDALLDPFKGYRRPTASGRRRSRHPAIERRIGASSPAFGHGAEGFARTVALSVLAANLHRIGLILQKRERKRRRRVA